MSAIHGLAGRGDPFELLAALEAGAGPNDPTGRDGQTPLMTAAKRDNAVAVRLLLRFGADVDAIDHKGHTALLHATRLEIRRLLLEAGADPDYGRLAGMTSMAFFASFRDRQAVEFFLSYGANPGERTREGETVQALLDDPTTIWRSWAISDTPERRRSDRTMLLKVNDHLRISPERYVSEHRSIILWGLGTGTYDDPAHAAWAMRIAELLRSPDLLEKAYRAELTCDELQDALRSLEQLRRRTARDARRKQRMAEFEAFYFAEP